MSNEYDTLRAEVIQLRGELSDLKDRMSQFRMDNSKLMKDNTSLMQENQKLMHDNRTLMDGQTSPLAKPKTMGNSDINGARVNVKDIKVFGDGDTFKLLCKASSEAEGWMKSTKVLTVEGEGCFVQVTTQQRNPDGSYAVAEALAFAPGVRMQEHSDGIRKLVSASTSP